MSKDKNMAVWEYISQCPFVKSYLTFNTISEFVDATGLIPISSDSAIKSYTDGSNLMEYNFSIIKMEEFDTGTTQTNLVSFSDMEKFGEWLKEQNEKGNYPAFPDNCIMESIEPLQNMPDLAGVDDSNIAKYMFSFRIIYIQEV